MVARRQKLHQLYLSRNTFEYNPHFQQTLSVLTGRFGSRNGSVEATRQSYGETYQTVQQQASALAYIDAFEIIAVVCLLALGLVLFARKTKPGQAAMAH
jgi:DHA2 family multidrug resistance protein